jgi:hypothetical protein
MGMHLAVASSDSAAGHLKQRRLYDRILPLSHRLVRDPAPAAATYAGFFDDRAALWRTDREAFGTHLESFADGLARTHLGVLASLWPTAETITYWLDPTVNAYLVAIQTLAGARRAGLSFETLQLVLCAQPAGGVAPSDPAPLQWPVAPAGEGLVDLAARAWSAFTATTPSGWAALLDEDLSALPGLARTVMRQLQDLPDRVTGLARSEREVLAHLADAGSAGLTVEALLRTALANEAQPPELMLFELGKMLDHLAAGPCPAVLGLSDGPFNLGLMQDTARHRALMTASLRLSDHGRGLLDGEATVFGSPLVERWWGGTRLGPQADWRWDADRLRLIPPGGSEDLR